TIGQSSAREPKIGERDLVENRETLAARYCGIKAWIERSRGDARKVPVVIRPLKFVQETIFLNDHLVVVEGAEGLHRMIGDVPEVENRVLELMLDTERPGLHIRGSEIGIGYPERPGRVKSVIFRLLARYRIIRLRNFWQVLAQRSAQPEILRRADQPLIGAFDIVQNGGDRFVIDEMNTIPGA